MNNRLIDVHCHILYGIDDGSKTLDESIEMIKKMKDIGFTDIIITPHYIEGTSYMANNKEKTKLFNNIKRILKKENIDINLYLGNEVFVYNNMYEGIISGDIKTLNDSKYLLMEVPFEQEINNLEDYLFKLITKGIIPVLAHPERYKFLQEQPGKIIHLKEMGVLFQGNYASIIGRYGKSAKKLLKIYLKQGYINFLGSDIHHENGSFYENFEKMKKKIIKIIGKDKFIELSETNPMKFIEPKVK